MTVSLNGDITTHSAYYVKVIVASASESVTSEDELLNRDSEQLAPWQRWGYWKNRGMWQDPDTYCDSLRGFIERSTNASSFLFQESGRPVNLSRFSPGKIQGNFFIRADPAFSGNYCKVDGRDSDFVVGCSRKITKSALVFNSVYTRTLDNLRTCVGRLGWREDTSREHACTAAYTQASGGCSHTFTRGPQNMWLFSGFQDEVFTIGIQIVLENKKGPPVQGEYETVDADHLVVRSALAGADRGIVIEQTYDHGNLVSAVWEQGGETLKSVRYNPDGTRAEYNSTQFGRLSIQYETHFHKPSVFTLANVGTLIETYDADGNIVSHESAPPSASSTISRALNGSLELFPEVVKLVVEEHVAQACPYLDNCYRHECYRHEP